MAHQLFRGTISCRNILVQVRWAHNRGTARSAQYQGIPKYNRNTKISQEQMVEGDNMEDWINEEGPSLVEDFIKEEQKQRKKIKFQIIKKKYFKEPKEVNLLTWDAKEQIRYLQQEFPDEWTIERLSESFPASPEGIIRLLKSKWTPRTLAEIAKHDTRVQKSLTKLKSGNHQQTGPVLTRYQKLLKEGKLRNAAGSSSLPAPQRHHLLTDGGGKGLRFQVERKEPGTFEKIVKDYCEKRQQVKENHERKEGDHQKLVKVTDKITNNITKVLSLDSGQEGSHIHGQKIPSKFKPNSDEIQREKMKSTLLESVYSPENLSSSQATSILEGLSEIPCDTNEPNMINKEKEPLRRKGRRRKSLATSMLPTEELAIYETGKVIGRAPQHAGAYIEDARGTRLPDNYDSEESILSQFPTPDTSNKLRPPGGDTAQVWAELRYDTPVGLSDEPEAYLYSEDKGYQHPLGKRDREPLKVEIPSGKTALRKLYRKGNAYYDEDGQLLYRVP